MTDISIRRLEEEMSRRNLSGRNLSNKAGLSCNSVHYILTGKTKNLKFENLKKIAEVLNVSPYYLMGKGQYNNYEEYGCDNKISNIINKVNPEIPYNHELYHKVLEAVEKSLFNKNILKLEILQNFVTYIYPNIYNRTREDQSYDLESYVEGVVTYAMD